MQEIPLTKGYFAIIDDEDFEEISKYKWHAHLGRDGKPYADSRRAGRMTRFLMKAKKAERVDHINHNTLDNQRSNLRTCTAGQNSCNMRVQPNKNGYKGVCKDYIDRFGLPRYRGLLRLRKKCFRGKFRRSAVEAAKDYDDLAKKHFKEFACLNFPDSIRREHIARMIMSTNGRIFKITFIKRTGGREERTIFGRVGVWKDLKGVGMRFSPEKMKLIVIWDMQDREYKAIPIEGIQAFYFGGKKYRVD